MLTQENKVTRIHSVTKYQEKLRIKSEGLNPTPNLCQIKLLSTHYFPLVNREIIILLELVYLIIITEMTLRSTGVCIDFGSGCLQTAESRAVLAVCGGDSGTWQGALPSHTIPAPSQGLGWPWVRVSGLCSAGRWHCHTLGWALPISSLAPAQCLLAGLSVAFSVGFCRSASGSSVNVCQGNVMGFMIPVLPSVFKLGFHAEEIRVTFGYNWFGSFAKMLRIECKINILFQIECNSFRSWGLGQFCLSCFIFMV